MKRKQKKNKDTWERQKKRQKIKGSSIHRFNTQNRDNSAINFDSKNTSESSRFTIGKVKNQ